jgi:predicted DNA-binding transcriptional regulator AlpA
MPKSNSRSLRPRLAQRASPFRLYRTGRLAELLDVDPSTIWKWVQSGVLPPPIEIGPRIRGWSEDQLAELFAQKRERVGG